MSRKFPLAGLLRLRRIQEDQAAVSLAAAHTKSRQHNERRSQARTELSGTQTEVSSVASLRAVAAARACASGMLAELDALAAVHRGTVTEAETAYKLSRIQSVSIENLEERHASRVAEEDLKSEQAAVDEAANRLRHHKTTAVHL